ncbi:uncharacterized protein LOC134654319 [Cydia amplana]|uniref:uncharacterized protein LOC134654319 n=1 Tax=Cydia amplana TaxID=1869771 RepID=UPI002FE51856
MVNMHFGKLNILLLVLVFSLDFVRCEENYDAAIDDDADEGVDDDAGVADDVGGDLAAANDGDAVADDDAVNVDPKTNFPINGDIIEAESVDPVDLYPGMKDPNPAHTCVPGTHFMIECNYCFCYKPNIQSCTFMSCRGFDKKKTLTSNPAKRLAFKRLRTPRRICGVATPDAVSHAAGKPLGGTAGRRRTPHGGAVERHR